jgi:hypothetical protein
LLPVTISSLSRFHWFASRVSLVWRNSSVFKQSVSFF